MYICDSRRMFFCMNTPLKISSGQSVSRQYCRSYSSRSPAKIQPDWSQLLGASHLGEFSGFDKLNLAVGKKAPKSSRPFRNRVRTGHPRYCSLCRAIYQDIYSVISKNLLVGQFNSVYSATSPRCWQLGFPAGPTSIGPLFFYFLTSECNSENESELSLNNWSWPSRNVPV